MRSRALLAVGNLFGDSTFTSVFEDGTRVALGPCGTDESITALKPLGKPPSLVTGREAQSLGGGAVFPLRAK